MDELEDLPEPIGKFILENGEGTMTNTGMYFHYSEVCKLLKLYKEIIKKENL